MVRHDGYTFVTKFACYWVGNFVGELCDNPSTLRPTDTYLVFQVTADHPGQASEIADRVSPADVPILLKDPAERSEECVAVGVTSGMIRHMFSLRAVPTVNAVTDGVTDVQSSDPLSRGRAGGQGRSGRQCTTA
jgi:hypothetical protein